MIRKLYLQKAKESPIRRLHPWIFPKAIAKDTGNCVTGELVDVYGADETFIGVGVYNEHSLYRVRLLAYAFEPLDCSSLANILSYRFLKAKRLRENLQLPHLKTNAYRLLNSEGDGLSGLTIDRFNDVAVVSSSAFWVEAHKTLICELIKEHLSINEIVWLSDEKTLAQDGWKNELPKVTPSSADVLESGITYQVNFASTQKTGLFLDQRENHERIGSIAKGKRVLDLYTYTGGFALHAAKNGAVKVTAIDSSSDAIALAKKNAMLNDVNFIEFIEGDARDYLAKASEYDLVVLDPPKLVPSHKHLERAKNYYRFLHREVFKAMQSGSILLTCNCSSALDAVTFTELVSAQALAASKMVRILGVFGPASCHPTLSVFKEGQYLTALLLAVN